MQHAVRRLCALTSFALLGACGGGGGDGPAVTPPSSVPLASAINKLQTEGIGGVAFNVTGSASNGVQTYPITGSLTYSLTPIATATTFEGQPALSGVKTLTGTITVNGKSAPATTTETEYVSPSYVTLGTTSTGDYCVATSSTAPPKSASVGTSGQLDVQTCYTDGTKTTLDYTQTRTFSVATGTSSSNLLLRVTTTESGGATSTFVENYLVGTDGSITFTGFSGSDTDSGATLTLQSL